MNRTDRTAHLRQTEIQTDTAQESALAGHIRTGDQEATRGVTDCYIVGYTGGVR